MTPIPCQRDRFDLPREVAYLNCAYMAPLAHRVSEAIAAGAAVKRRPWTYTAADFFGYADETRGLFAKLIGAAADDVAITPSASYGLAVAARNLPLQRGQHIVLLADQFPSNVYIWRAAAASVGAAVKTVCRETGAGWTEALLAAIGPDTAIVAVPNCHWADGGLVDLSRVGEACRAVGAALALDLTQSLGALPFDVRAVRPDFMVAAAYKWLLGPYGVAMLYAASSRQHGQPIEQNWMNRAGSEDFARLVDYADDFQPGARRYDMGEKSNPPLLMGASAALRLLMDWDVASIAGTLGARNETLAARADAIGLVTAPNAQRAPHFLSLGLPKPVPDLTGRLAAEQVFVSLRGSSLRVTPHLYNDEADCDRLFEVLERALG